MRRVDIAWRGDEVAAFDRLKVRADALGITVGDLLKRLSQG